LKEEGKVMDTLASLVQDVNGNCIWQTLDKDKFALLKSTINTSHLLGKERVSDFDDDTLMKKFLRKIFEAVLK
jgi:hypothetical protein